MIFNTLSSHGQVPWVAEHRGCPGTYMRTYKLYEERTPRELACHVRDAAFQNTTPQSVSSKFKVCLLADELTIL